MSMVTPIQKNLFQNFGIYFVRRATPCFGIFISTGDA